MYERKGIEIVLGKLFDQYIVKEIMSHTPREVMMRELKEELERRKYVIEKFSKYVPKKYLNGKRKHECNSFEEPGVLRQVFAESNCYFCVPSIKRKDSILCINSYVVTYFKKKVMEREWRFKYYDKVSDEEYIDLDYRDEFDEYATQYLQKLIHPTFIKHRGILTDAELYIMQKAYRKKKMIESSRLFIIKDGKRIPILFSSCIK